MYFAAEVGNFQAAKTPGMGAQQLRNFTKSANALLSTAERVTNDLSQTNFVSALGAMIFGRRLGCVSSNNDSANIHEFVHCVQQIFSESAKMAMVSPKLACALRLPMWRRFENAAGRALDLGELLLDSWSGMVCQLN